MESFPNVIFSVAMYCKFLVAPLKNPAYFQNLLFIFGTLFKISRPEDNNFKGASLECKGKKDVESCNLAS